MYVYFRYRFEHNVCKELYLLFEILCSSKLNYFCFRALKTRGNTPKYGLIFHSSFIGRASARNKGRMARYLANKCSIASRIDCFLGEFDVSEKEVFTCCLFTISFLSG